MWSSDQRAKALARPTVFNIVESLPEKADMSAGWPKSYGKYSGRFENHWRKAPLPNGIKSPPRLGGAAGLSPDEALIGGFVQELSILARVGRLHLKEPRPRPAGRQFTRRGLSGTACVLTSMISPIQSGARKYRSPP